MVTHDGLEDPELDEMTRLLPTWFVERMARDTWAFGLMLANGRTLAVEHLNSVVQDANGNLWIDVDLMDLGDFKSKFYGRIPGELVGAPTSRTQASIAVQHIVAVFELADT